MSVMTCNVSKFKKVMSDGLEEQRRYEDLVANAFSRLCHQNSFVLDDSSR